jgi:protein-tyrosine phosphatase
MVRRALVVCTANVCRSPVAERLLTQRLDSRVDPDGEPWVVTSAGTADVVARLDPNTVTVATEAGLDLADHRPRVLTAEVLATDGADLVLGMAREHVRQVVALDPTAWPRTFTLKELVRRAHDAATPAPGETFEHWLARLSCDRTPEALLGADPLDDIEDPYGAPRPYHRRMLKDIDLLVDELAGLAPWPPTSTGSEAVYDDC